MTGAKIRCLMWTFGVASSLVGSLAPRENSGSNSRPRDAHFKSLRTCFDESEKHMHDAVRKVLMSNGVGTARFVASRSLSSH